MTLALQLLIGVVLLFVLGAVCYMQGFNTGRRIGTMEEQSYQYRHNRQKAQQREVLWFGRN